MKRLLVLCVAGTIASASSGAPGPFLIGESSRDLTPRDLADITALTAPHGTIWLLDVQEDWFLKGPNLEARAYLAPDTSSSTLRRGRFLWTYQEATSNARGYEWRVSGGPMSWAQVAPANSEFGSTLARPQTLDRPFKVDGQISDADLVALVGFIRGSPSKPVRTSENADGSWSSEIGVGVDGKNAIITIEVKAECFVKVTTERRRGAGQVIEVSKTGDGWRVVSVAEWVV